MPGYTPHGLPYPVGSDAPDGPGGIYSLATAIDNLMSDEVGYTLSSGFNATNTGVHSTKFARLVAFQFNVSTPNNTLTGGAVVLTLNTSSWYPAVSIDFMCEVRNNGGGAAGYAQMYMNSAGLQFSGYVPNAGSLTNTLPANSILIGSLAYRCANQ